MIIIRLDKKANTRSGFMNKDSRMTTRDMILSGFFVAIVFVATYLLQIRLPIPATGGLIHLGNIAMFSIALKYGKKFGAISGGFGMALFDVASMWVAWAPATLIIRFTAGFVIGKVSETENGQGNNVFKNIIALMVGGVVIIVGYFIFEAWILGIGLAASASVLGNLIQIGIGFISIGLIKALPNVSESV